MHTAVEGNLTFVTLNRSGRMFRSGFLSRYGSRQGVFSLRSGMTTCKTVARHAEMGFGWFWYVLVDKGLVYSQTPEA